MADNARAVLSGPFVTFFISRHPEYRAAINNWLQQVKTTPAQSKEELWRLAYEQLQQVVPLSIIENELRAFEQAGDAHNAPATSNAAAPPQVASHQHSTAAGAAAGGVAGSSGNTQQPSNPPQPHHHAQPSPQQQVQQQQQQPQLPSSSSMAQALQQHQLNLILQSLKPEESTFLANRPQLLQVSDQQLENLQKGAAPNVADLLGRIMSWTMGQRGDVLRCLAAAQQQQQQASQLRPVQLPRPHQAQPQQQQQQQQPTPQQHVARNSAHRSGTAAAAAAQQPAPVAPQQLQQPAVVRAVSFPQQQQQQQGGVRPGVGALPLFTAATGGMPPGAAMVAQVAGGGVPYQVMPGAGWGPPLPGGGRGGALPQAGHLGPRPGVAPGMGRGGQVPGPGARTAAAALASRGGGGHMGVAPGSHMPVRYMDQQQIIAAAMHQQQQQLQAQHLQQQRQLAGLPAGGYNAYMGPGAAQPQVPAGPPMPSEPPPPGEGGLPRKWEYMLVPDGEGRKDWFLTYDTFNLTEEQTKLYNQLKRRVTQQLKKQADGGGEGEGGGGGGEGAGGEAGRGVKRRAGELDLTAGRAADLGADMDFVAEFVEQEAGLDLIEAQEGGVQEHYLLAPEPTKRRIIERALAGGIVKGGDEGPVYRYLCAAVSAYLGRLLGDMARIRLQREDIGRNFRGMVRGEDPRQALAAIARREKAAANLKEVAEQAELIKAASSRRRMDEKDKEQAKKAKDAQVLEIQKKGVAKTLSRLGFANNLRKFGGMAPPGLGLPRSTLAAIKQDVAAAGAAAAAGDAGAAGADPAAGPGATTQQQQQQGVGGAPPPLQVPDGQPGGGDGAGVTPGTARTAGSTGGTPLGSTGGTPGSTRGGPSSSQTPVPRGAMVAGSQEAANGASTAAAAAARRGQPVLPGGRPQSIQGLLLAGGDVQALVQPGSAAATAGDGRVTLDLVDFMEALARDPHASHGELLYRLYGTAALSTSVGFLKPSTGF